MEATKNLTFTVGMRCDPVAPPSFSDCERWKLEFRAEFFNVLNHTNFTNPDTNVQSGAAFGQIFGSYFARQSQFAAKVIF